MHQNLENVKVVSVIGLTGKMGAGKSTVAALLQKKFPESRIVKLAEPLYDMQDYVYSRVGLSKLGASISKDRALLQQLGDWGRNRDKDMFLKLFSKRVENLHKVKPDTLVLCDDVRFDNEAMLVKEIGGLVIEVRSNVDRIVKVNEGHISEQGVNPKLVDIVIANNGTMSDLENQLNYLFDHINDLGGCFEA